METRLADKVVLITGASGGIGRAMARAFAAEGARLALHAHKGGRELERWVARQPWRERALAVRADVAAAEEVDAAFAEVRERWGRIDVCIANAGVWPPEEKPLVELSEARVREVLEVNLLGAFWTARAFLRVLAEVGPREDGDGAALVFTGSTAGAFGERGHSDYAASKAALGGLVRSLKNEIVALDPYARVNLVQPGWTLTDMTRERIEEPGALERVVRTMPLRQLGRAEDVARAAVFLASPAAARHVSGQEITVAGGMEGRVQWEAEGVDAGLVRERLRPDEP